MVVLERFTKMAHFIGLYENATSKDNADTFRREVRKLDGLLTQIRSDMDAKFSAAFWESLCMMLGVKRPRSSGYYPQTDRQTESTNQVPDADLRTFVNYDQNN